MKRQIETLPGLHDCFYKTEFLSQEFLFEPLMYLAEHRIDLVVI
jgi:hypothetical protein